MVAASVLRLIERLVGAYAQRLAAFLIGKSDSDTGRDPNGPATSVRCFQSARHLEQPVRRHDRLLLVGLRREDAEFLSSDPAKDIICAQDTAPSAGHGLEDGVAPVMPTGVVYGLEMILYVAL